MEEKEFKGFKEKLLENVKEALDNYTYSEKKDIVIVGDCVF